MVKNLFCKAGDVDCIPGWGTKIPHGLEQLRQRATTREPEGLQPRPNVCMLRRFSGPTLCDPMDYSLPGSSLHGIFQARILEWVAMPFSRESSRLRE